MHNSSVLLFDSGRVPMWIRLPALAFGCFVLWLAIAIAAHSVFDVSIGLPMSDDRGSPLLGSLACLIIGAVWVFVWFAQLRILFDKARRELVVRTRGYFRTHDRRISLAGSRAVCIRHVRNGLASTTWRVTVEYDDGRSEHVTDIQSGVEPLAHSIETATKIPVRQYDFAA